MEGTRNERVLIMTVTYVIGFVTAFILFGVNQIFDNSSNNYAAVYTVNYPQDLKEELAPSKATAVTSDVSFAYTGGKLVVNTAAGELLLSYNPLVSGLPIFEDQFGQGMHYNDIRAIASDSKSHIYFCEQQSPEADFCASYLYDVKKSLIRPLLLDGTPVTLSNANSDSVYWSGDNLIINGQIHRF